MAIQHRRGKYSDFDPSKLLPGELAIVLSGDPASGTGRSVYVCFETGVVKRFATYEDFETEIQNATEDVQAAFTEEIRSAINSAITAANSANTAVEAANKATAAANEAAEAANAVVLGDISKNTVTFTQAEERTLPESGEDTATLFGKIKKWLADLAKVAFSGSYDDLSNKPTLGKAAEMEVANNDTTTSEGYVADARAVNLLGEEIDETNKELDTLKSSFNELNTNRIIIKESDGIHFVNNLVLPISNAPGGLPVTKIYMSWHDTDGWCLMFKYYYNDVIKTGRIKLTESD